MDWVGSCARASHALPMALSMHHGCGLALPSVRSWVASWRAVARVESRFGDRVAYSIMVKRSPTPVASLPSPDVGHGIGVVAAVGMASGSLWRPSAALGIVTAEASLGDCAAVGGSKSVSVMAEVDAENRFVVRLGSAWRPWGSA